MSYHFSNGKVIMFFGLTPQSSNSATNGFPTKNIMLGYSKAIFFISSLLLIGITSSFELFSLSFFFLTKPNIINPMATG